MRGARQVEVFGQRWLRCVLVQVAFVLGYILLSAGSGQADSELQKFEATIPPRAGLGFSMYQACALTTRIDKKREGASFRNVEIAIADACRKHLSEADRDLAKTGLSADERTKMIERFSALALVERRLRFEGKPIPGYRMSPFTAQVMECDRTIRAAKSAFTACVDQALQKLLPFSTEASDIVADAAMGMCEPAQNKMVTSTTTLCFYGDRAKAESVVSSLSRQLRSLALGKVAAARAELRRRQVTPEQVPVLQPKRSEERI